MLPAALSFSQGTLRYQLMLSSPCRLLVTCCVLQCHLSTSWILHKPVNSGPRHPLKKPPAALLTLMSPPQAQQLSFLHLLFPPLGATSINPLLCVLLPPPLFYTGRAHQRRISDMKYISQLVFVLCLAEIRRRIRLSSKRVLSGSVTKHVLSPCTQRNADEQQQLVAGA